MQKFFLPLTVILLFSVTALRAEPLELEVITLKYRTAQDVIPILQPFVNSAGGTLTGTQNQLIVRTTPMNLAEIRQILAGIDTLPKRLIITVRQDTGLNLQRREAEISGNAKIGNAQVIVPRRSGSGLVVEQSGGGSTVRGRVLDGWSSQDENATQRLQVLEGGQAFIRAGQSVPVQGQTVISTPQGAQTVDSVQFRDVTSGFYVRPRVSGDIVTVEINQQRDTPAVGGSVNVQQASSVVSGRLGEWMELGGIAQQRSQQNKTLTSRDSDRSSDQRRIYIKVEEIR